MKKLFLFIATLGMLLPQMGRAQIEIEEDGICYYLEALDETAMVAGTHPGHPSDGELFIPLSVQYGGTNYDVTSIRQHAFEDREDLTAVILPNSVESIGDFAFADCSNLTSITIPIRVVSIGIYAFAECTGLTSITVEAGTPPSVGSGCFSGVDKAIPVYVPSSKAATAYRAADGWNEFENTGFPYESNGIYYYIFSDGTAEVTRIPKEYTGAIGIPKTVSYGGKTYNVTSIGKNAFSNCANITSIVIPSSVKSIGEHAFAGCSGLTSMAVEAETPPSVGEFCFFGVDETIPVCVPNSKYQTADGWKDFKNLILPIPYEIGGIYYNLLLGCTAEVTENPDTYEGAIEIPETVSYGGITFNVTGIGNYAFNNCANMTSIAISSSVTNIGDYAFANCISLSTVTIPNNVESIGEQAFYYCKKITSFYIPSSVKSIGSMAFGQCEGLTSITIEAETPPSVGYECFFEVKSSIPVYVFSRKAAEAYKAAVGWSYFSNIVPPSTYKSGGIYYTLLPNGTAEVTENPNKYTGAIEISKTVSYGGKTYNVTSIGEKAFYECEDLTSATIPGSVTSIRENAFGYCNLTTITIPGSVVSIGDYAFQYCDALTTITIPGSVESIGSFAFADCTGLTSIIVEAETPASVEDECFFGVDKTIPVYVPSSTAATAYRAADGWKDFTNIIYQYTLEDKTKYTASEAFKAEELIYTRTFSNTEWQALYVPFSMDYDEWSEKYDIAEIHNFIEYDDDDNGEFDRTYLVVLKMTSGSTEPNYPYLIRAKETGTHSLVLQDKTLEAAESTSIDCRSVKNEYTFTGTYTEVTDMYANGYYALSGGALNKANAASVTLNPQRWYMEVTSRTGGAASVKAQSIQILVDGEEGIDAPSTSPKGESLVAYDLTGRMVSPTTNVRGVNIVNGKKLIK